MRNIDHIRIPLFEVGEEVIYYISPKMGSGIIEKIENDFVNDGGTFKYKYKLEGFDEILDESKLSKFPVT